MNKQTTVQDLIKTEVIVFALKKVSDYDFSNYSVPVLSRRLTRLIDESRFEDLNDLLSAILNDEEDVVEQAIQQLTITHTKFFRDEGYFKRLFYSVLPQLDAYPDIKVWSIACSGGEEVYSLAVMFAIKQMSERVSLLGSDININALKRAKSGQYEIERLKELQEQFRQLELNNISIVDFIEVEGDHFRFKTGLAENIKFEVHNIINGSSFGQMHLVSCRNVLIYLSTLEQQRVVEELLIPSIAPKGFLMLGDAENIEVFKDYPELKKLEVGLNLYQKN